jgi:uroporphyrinogen-III synthase
MNETSSYGGRTRKDPILLLKTKSTPHDGYEEYFSLKVNGTKWSHEPTFVPVLEHRFQEEALAIVRELLEKKEISKNIGARYGGLIFTSQRAVEAFTKVVENGTFISPPLCRESSLIDFPI